MAIPAILGPTRRGICRPPHGEPEFLLLERSTMAVEAFALCECSLARLATGRSCSNLRELLEAIRIVPDGVLEYHMARCALDDHFELYEFPNDLARWCWDDLGDHVLGEQLGLVDPYQHQTHEGLRQELVNVIEARAWELDRVPWCRPGLELHLIAARLVAYDTGERFSTPTALAEALPRISTRSIFYHVHEARRRTAGQTDDFSAWLEAYGADSALVTRLRAIDFYFLNLNQLRDKLIGVLGQFLPISDAQKLVGV
jgi:hypothetical protein